MCWKKKKIMKSLISLIINPRLLVCTSTYCTFSMLYVVVVVVVVVWCHHSAPFFEKKTKKSYTSNLINRTTCAVNHYSSAFQSIQERIKVDSEKASKHKKSTLTLFFSMHLKLLLASLLAIPFTTFSMSIVGVSERMLLTASMKAAEIGKGIVSLMLPCI